jgi:hypothetical protein
MNQPHHGHQQKPRRAPHKDWRVWAIVLVMLAGMAMYVLSLDEQIVPETGETGERMPAAAGP